MRTLPPHRASIAPFLRVLPLHGLYHRWTAGQEHAGRVGGNYVFWLITEGCVEVRSARGHWELPTGTAFLFRLPGERTVATTQGASWFSVSLRATIYDSFDLFSPLPLPALWAPPSVEFAALQACVSGIARSWGVPEYAPVDALTFQDYLAKQSKTPLENDTERFLLCEAYARALFTYCWQRWSDQRLEDIAGSHFPEWMPIVLTRLRESPGIGVEELARAVGISRRQLGRVFHSAFGTSPLTFLNRRRLEEARQLLETSSFPLAEIARQTGFADVSHFNRAFKAAYHTPPETYRRQIAANPVMI